MMPFGAGKQSRQKLPAYVEPVGNNTSSSVKPFQLLGDHAQGQQSGLKKKSSKPKSGISIGDFRMIKVLGKGKFGLVHLAVHTETGFICAIKTILKKGLKGQTEEQNQRIKNQTIREIKNQSYLSHPNIIQLYSVFCDDEKIYLVMEAGADGQLFNFICGRSKLTEETTSFLVRQILLGLNHMHEHHIIHRDIKPENIIFNYGTAKICDFGWSVYCSQDIRSTICGTPLYFPPEIISGKTHNEKIDAWAIGTLTHELLTGDNPFRITKRSEINRIVTDNFIMHEGSRSSRDFISVALEKDPERRITVKEMLAHPFIRKYEGLDTSEQICRILQKREQS